MPKRRQPEATLQKDVCEYLNGALPPGWEYWHNYQNAPTVQAQARLKALGVKAGLPDMMVVGPTDGDAMGVNLIAIELKSAKGRTSIAQEDWLDRLARMGAHAAVCRSIDDVEDTLRFAGVPIRAGTARGMSDGND